MLRFRFTMPQLLAAAALTVAPAAHATAPDAEAWSRRLTEARTAVAAAGPGEAAGKRLEAEWQAIAAAYPIFTDWTLQDLGTNAIALLTFERHAEAEQQLRALAGGGSGDALARYVAFATARRHTRIADTLRAWGPIAFTEGHSYRMSFIGYTEGLSDARHERFFKPGARLAVLDFGAGDGFGAQRTLLDDPHGMMRDVDVSFDRTRLLFAWKKSDRLDDYHLYEVRPEDGHYRQLTFGLGRADYEPIYLPDGDILFTSTRPEQSVPCWWTEISNLYRMDGRGRYLRRLAIDQVHALYPQLMADGRVTYTRWDYNDRGQNYPHPIFSMRPDGQDQRAFYGGNSWFPTSLLHTRGIPGSPKAMSIAAGHHTYQQGKLVVLDNREGRDEGPGMSFIAPRRVVPYERKDRAMQDGDQFRYPYPFSESEFLVSYRPAWGVERFGLYWMDADGARELLHADPALDVARMAPLGRRPVVAKIKDEVDYTKKTGTYYVHDVYRGVGLEGIARGTARKIRVVRLNYRAAGVGETHNSGEGGGSLNSTPVAVANGTWDVKEILGDVDIEADGSALFEVPAMESLYLQVLDAKGQVIQTSRTWDTVRPGEQKACTGCHEKSNGNVYPFRQENTLAWRRAPQTIQPFYGPTRGFSFAREIQPILDAKCVSCHDGSKPDAADLRGIAVHDADLNKRAWTKSYLYLTGAQRAGNGNYARANTEQGLVSWISKMSRPTEIPPYFAGAARSRLMPLLEQGHRDAKLTPEELHKFAAWMDLLVPFSGDYREGSDWNARQHAYYTYYEGKRAAEAAEEQAAIAAYVARAGGPAAVAPASPPAGFTAARYREVLRDARLLADGDRRARVGAGEPLMVDRLWLRAEGGPAEQAVLVKNGRSGRKLAGARLTAGGPAQAVVLAEPVRSDLLRVEADGAGAWSDQLVSERALGVAVAEVPVVDGFHPYLDHTPEAKPQGVAGP